MTLRAKSDATLPEHKAAVDKAIQSAEGGFDGANPNPNPSPNPNPNRNQAVLWPYLGRGWPCAPGASLGASERAGPGGGCEEEAPPMRP